MTTSGTTAFNPSLGGIGAYALRRCGVKYAAITAEHLADVAMAANMVLSGWSVNQPNLWRVQQSTVSITANNPGPYVLPTDVVLVLDVYVTISGQDRILTSISRSEYAAYPVKTTTSPPTVYWLDRVVPPTMTFYPAPDQTYTVTYYAVHQDQDAVVPGAATLDLPHRSLNAFKDSLTAELAVIHAPDRAPALDALAQRSYQAAMAQDRENAILYITPNLSGYFA